MTVIKREMRRIDSTSADQLIGSQDANLLWKDIRLTCKQKEGFPRSAFI